MEVGFRSVVERYNHKIKDLIKLFSIISRVFKSIVRFLTKLDVNVLTGF